MSEEKHHIIPYRSHILVLALLISLTLLSVAVTQIELSRWSTIAAILIAGIKSTFVLLIFMHLKFDQRVFKRMATFIFLLVLVVIFVTMLDYIFR